MWNSRACSFLRGKWRPTGLAGLQSVAASEEPKDSVCGYVALGITAWSKNPFLGMVAGVVVRYCSAYIGL